MRLKNIIPPAEIQGAMEKQMKAEREKRQTILEATAHKESVVARAEGDKQAKILAAQAERDAQIALAEGRAKSIALVYQAEAEGLKALKEANIDAAVLPSVSAMPHRWINPQSRSPVRLPMSAAMMMRSQLRPEGWPADIDN